MGTFNIEAVTIMFSGITDFIYWGLAITGWWLVVVKVTQVLEAVNKDILIKRETGVFQKVIKAPVVFLINVCMIIIFTFASVGRVFGSKCDKVIMKKWGELVQFDTDVIGEREQVMVERGEVGGHIVSGKAMVKYESENLKKRTRGHTVMRGGILETLVHGEWGEAGQVDVLMELMKKVVMGL